jgi:two-component system KDP operon response regulator KdpE
MKAWLPNPTDAETFNAAARVLQPLILIVEDNVLIHNMLRMALVTQGYGVLEASSAQIALELLSQSPALIIVDLDVRGHEGHDLLRVLRGRNDYIPIVALSNRADDTYKVQALDLGARDYLTKPFGINEFSARLRAALRLRPQLLFVEGADPVLRSGDLFVDLRRRVVKVGEKKVYLTPKEYELLLIFLQHVGKVLTHRFLLGALWDHSTNAQYLRIYVRQLRQKIELNPEHPQLVLTETGIGYRMACAA